MYDPGTPVAEIQATLDRIFAAQEHNSSGGFIADSKVDGITINGSQQQRLTRDSELGRRLDQRVWNQVFSGVKPYSYP